MSASQYQAPPPQRGDGSASVRTNALAVAAFVSSFFIGVTGVILGVIALNQIETTGERGSGLAIAALVVGCAYMAIFAYVSIGALSA
jgi:peptidyl-prolyl cis-trans isomerase B (cyclophilin B)